MIWAVWVNRTPQKLVGLGQEWLKKAQKLKKMHFGGFLCKNFAPRHPTHFPFLVKFFTFSPIFA